MVRDFCDEYFKSSRHPFVMRPFIRDCPFGDFNCIPPIHDERLGDLNKYLKEEKCKRSEETSDIELDDGTDMSDSLVKENMEGENSIHDTVENSITMILDTLAKLHLGEGKTDPPLLK